MVQNKEPLIPISNTGSKSYTSSGLIHNGPILSKTGHAGEFENHDQQIVDITSQFHIFEDTKGNF